MSWSLKSCKDKAFTVLLKAFANSGLIFLPYQPTVSKCYSRTSRRITFFRLKIEVQTIMYIVIISDRRTPSLNKNTLKVIATIVMGMKYHNYFFVICSLKLRPVLFLSRAYIILHLFSIGCQDDVRQILVKRVYLYQAISKNQGTNLPPHLAGSAVVLVLCEGRLPM